MTLRLGIDTEALNRVPDYGGWKMNEYDFVVTLKKLKQELADAEAMSALLSEMNRVTDAAVAAIAERDGLRRRAEAAEAEVARLRVVLEMRDRFLAGEPSNPPRTGRDAAPLDNAAKGGDA
jgi:hypothetical protein